MTRQLRIEFQFTGKIASAHKILLSRKKKTFSKVEKLPVSFVRVQKCPADCAGHLLAD